MIELVTIAAVLIALAVGARVNHHWAARHPDDGITMADLVNPVATISAVLLAFVMVEALASYDRARQDATAEAHTVDKQAESAARLADPELSREFQADLVCYARAVQYQEWPHMLGGGEPSPETSHWSHEFERILAEVRRVGGDDEIDGLIDLDNERSDARLSRLDEANPSLPVGLNALMLAAVILSVLGLAMFMNPHNGHRANAVIMLMFGLVVGGTLISIHDLDRPYDGFTHIDPSEMEEARQSMEADLAIRYPSLQYPCDAEGIAITASD